MLIVLAVRFLVQFALNLEYLEGNFYSCATYGRPLEKSLWGGKPVKSIFFPGVPCLAFMHNQTGPNLRTQLQSVLLWL